MNEDLVKKIKTMYVRGSKYENIMKKYDITKGQLIYLIRKNKWTRKTRGKALKGNKNAKGNKGGPGAEKGNKRAVTTGEYESIYEEVLTDDERSYFNNEVESPRDELLKTYKTLVIRKIRIMKRLKELEDATKEMTIDTMRKTTTGRATTTDTLAISKDDKILKFNDALTRVDRQISTILTRLALIPESDNKEDKTSTSILNDISRQLNVIGNFDGSTE